MKKVLIISYYTPPQNTASAVRTGKLMKYLPSFGWQPIILSVKDSGIYLKDYELFRDIDYKNIVRTNSFDPLQIINKFKKKADIYKNIRETKVGLKNFVKGLFPIDDKIGWMYFCLKRAEEIIRENKIDLIFVSLGGINHTAITGYKLSRKFKIPLIIEFRDLWADHPFVNRNIFGKIINNYWERKVINHATSIITLTQGFKKNLQEKYSLIDDKIQVIPNGFDEADVPKETTQSDNKVLTFTFCGNLYKDMTPEILFRVLSSLPKNELRILIRFIGDFRFEFWELKKKFEKKLNKKNVFIEVLQRMPYLQMLKELQKSDILLLFLPNKVKFNEIIHAKFFDYLAVQKPILAFLPEGSEVGNIIEKEKLGYLSISNDFKQSTDIVSQIISDVEKNKMIDFKISSEFRNKFTRSKIAEKLSIIFNAKTSMQRKDKILVVSNTAWNIYNFRFNIMREISNLGFSPLAVANYDSYVDEVEKEFEFHKIDIDSRGKNIINDFKTFVQFYKLYKKLNPKLILHFTHKPNIYGTLAAGILKIPCVNNIAGLGETFMKNNFVRKMAVLLYKKSQQFAEFIFFQNKDDKKLFEELGIIKKDNIDILPGSGIDTRKFSPQLKEKEDNIFRFLLLTRMLWTKGVAEYVEAAKKVKEIFPMVEFDIIGFVDNNNINAVPQKTIDYWNKKGIINFLGEQKDVRKFIGKCDCVVLPSFYREGVPRSLLEAGSMGKPIITTKNIGCKEVVDDGENGYLCEIKNSYDLRNKMVKMIELPKIELEQMGRKSREKILTNFDETIVIKKYTDVIKRILK